MTEQQTQQAAEMRPCPFCGGEAILNASGIFDMRFQVQCEHCYSGSGASTNADKVIAHWNARTLEPAVQQPEQPDDRTENPNFPMGAIENGRTFIERFKANHPALGNFGEDFPEIEQCFEYMAEYLLMLPKRESSVPPAEMGMRMEDVRIGMRMMSLYGGPVITVTELTEKGFKYSHPPYHLGARIGQTIGGEHYGYNGYSHYTEIEAEKPSHHSAPVAEVERIKTAIMSTAAGRGLSDCLTEVSNAAIAAIQPITQPAAQPDKAEVVERMAIAMHDLMSQGTSSRWDLLPEYRQSGFRNQAKAAYSALPPQRDDSGLDENYWQGSRMRHACFWKWRRASIGGLSWQQSSAM